MRRAHIVSSVIAILFAASLCAIVLLAQQAPKEKPSQHSSNPNSTSLKISLRLPDDSAFSGLASLYVVNSEGAEVAGKATESEGDTLFSDLAPGSYSVEASAPGFVSVKQPVEIKAGYGLETIFLVMKPEEFSGAGSVAFSTANENAAWHIPPGIDEVVPKVLPGVSCDLPVVLHGVGERMTQLVSNLEKFSATEHIEHFRVDNSGILRARETRSFEYVVLVLQNPVQGFQLDEYRNGSTDPHQFPAQIATEALPVMALIFHPLMVSDFKLTCEGLGESAGRPAWQARFEQRQDRPNRIRYYKINDNYYPVGLKGRAWIDAGTYQVLRLETDLIQPVKGIELARERLSIEYAQVQFHSHDLQLWLPQTAELYWERHGRQYFRRHEFSDFKIFSVDTDQKFQRPKESYSFTNTSDRDVPGVLIVNPVSGSKFRPVSIEFTVPAGQSVLKTIGTGKDVAIPGQFVGSARFVYNGPAGSVKVDAYLATESTLEVVPSTSPTPSLAH
jgi:hypothetical protein